MFRRCRSAGPEWYTPDKETSSFTMFNKIYQKLTKFTKTPEIVHFWSNFDCFPFWLDIWHTFFVTNRPLYTRLPFHQSSPPDRLFTLIIPRAAEDSRSHFFLFAEIRTFHLRCMYWNRAQIYTYFYFLYIRYLSYQRLERNSTRIREKLHESHKTVKKQ